MNVEKSMGFEAARDWLLARARDEGLEIEVLAQSSRELTLAAQNGALELVTEAEQAGIGLRLVDQGRAGYAYTEALDRESLAWILDEAREKFLIVGEAVVEDLDRYDALQVGIDGPIDRGHGAAADLLDNLVLAESPIDESALRHTRSPNRPPGPP